MENNFTSEDLINFAIWLQDEEIVFLDQKNCWEDMEENHFTDEEILKVWENQK